eukprot:gene32454-39242_t
MKRVTGLGPPYSVFFVCTILGYGTTTVIHFIIVSYLSQPENFAIYSISGLLALAVVSAWLVAITTNPEPSDGVNRSFHCFQVRVKRETRYCPDCKKMVFELDHHCYFLNTCVGAKNYCSFLSVVVFAGMQMLLHVAVSLYFQFDKDCWVKLENSVLQHGWAVWLLVLVHLVMSALQAILLIVLLGFHIYLSCVKRMGTFDWMLERRMTKRHKHSRYSGTGDENSMSSRMSERAITAARQRQMQREDFERSLAAGKKKGFEFFRSGNSSPSLLGSSLKKLFSFRDAAVVDGGDPPQLADLDLGDMEAGSGRYLDNAATIRDSNKDLNIALYVRSGSSSISSGKKQSSQDSSENQECTIKLATSEKNSPANETLRASIDLTGAFDSVLGDHDSTPLPSDEDQEAVMKKRLRKTDLLKQTLVKNPKVFPMSDSNVDENTLDRAIVAGEHVAQTGVGTRGSMMTVSYDSSAVSRSHTVTTEDAATTTSFQS